MPAAAVKRVLQALSGIIGRFKIKDFGPLLVAMDSHGGSIYQEVKSDVALKKEAVLKSLGITS